MGHGHDAKRTSAEQVGANVDGLVNEIGIPNFLSMHRQPSTGDRSLPLGMSASSIASRMTSPMRFVARPSAGDGKLTASRGGGLAGSEPALLFPRPPNAMVDGGFGDSDGDSSGRTLLNEFLYFLVLKGAYRFVYHLSTYGTRDSGVNA